MIFHWPQILMVILLAIDAGVSLAQHGKPRSPHSIWTSLIAIALNVWILSAGGFFGAAQ